MLIDFIFIFKVKFTTVKIRIIQIRFIVASRTVKIMFTIITRISNIKNLLDFLFKVVVFIAK
jgi:hypothetical protein